MVRRSIKVFRSVSVESEDAGGGAQGVKVRWLITKDMGAPNFAMRLFEVEPKGYSPLHEPSWEHEVFILEGDGVAFDGCTETPFKESDVVFVPAGDLHQFKNTGVKTLKFLCLIPNSAP